MHCTQKVLTHLPSEFPPSIFQNLNSSWNQSSGACPSYPIRWKRYSMPAALQSDCHLDTSVSSAKNPALHPGKPPIVIPCQKSSYHASQLRSEERRVGKECRKRGRPDRS